MADQINLKSCLVVQILLLFLLILMYHNVCYMALSLLLLHVPRSMSDC